MAAIRDERMIKSLCAQTGALSKNVLFQETTIIKKVDPKHVAMEAEVTQAAHRLSQTCNLFYSPRVLDFDRQNGILKLERLEGIVPLKECLGQSDDGVRLIRKVGKALAFVHSRLDIPRDAARLVPRNWRGPKDDSVTIHGDFNMVNVCYKKDSDSVTILDWATAPALPFVGTVGPRQLDLAHFVRSLLLQQKKFFRAMWFFSRRVDVFLNAYLGELGKPIDLNLLGDFLSRLNLAILRKQWRRKMVLSLAQTLVGHIIFRNLAKQWRRKQDLRSRQAISSGNSKKGQQTMKRKNDYRDSHTAKEKGNQYDARFRRFKWRKYLWEREQLALKQILRTYYGKRPINYLDFACGTGRILRFLKKYVNNSTGVDVSESMLNVCRRKLPEDEIIQADITRNDVLGEKTFNLITAFRFFPNAQDTLRMEVIQALARYLTPNGLLVFNNHRNKSSTLFTLGRMLKSDIPTMSNADIDRLVASVGLEIVEVFSMGVLPGYDNHPMFLPSFIHKSADWVADACGVGRTLCQNIIYVCRKAEPGEGECASQSAAAKELLCS